MTICTQAKCPEQVTDTMYAACNGCGGFFCDAHLLYCIAHEDQHCAECCDNGTAPTRGTTPRWARMTAPARGGSGGGLVGYGTLEDDEDLRMQRSVFTLGELRQLGVQAAIEPEQETDGFGHKREHTGRYPFGLRHSITLEADMILWVS